MTTKGKIFLCIASVVGVLAGVAGFVFGRYYIDNKKANFTEKYVLYVYPETTVEQIVDSLVCSAGAVRPGSIERCFKKLDVAGGKKPGRYIVEPSATSIYVARMLNFGWQTPQNMTLSGTMRSKGRIAKKISTQMMVDSASVAQALDSAEFLANYGFTPENVFALVLPDTYQMYWTASVEEIFDRLKKEYDAFWTQEREAKAKALGLSRKIGRAHV